MMNPRPKRGKEYIFEGETWYLNNIRPDGLYCLCNKRSMLPVDTYTTIDPKLIVEPKNHLKRNVSKTVERLNNKSDLDKWYESQDVPERCENCNQKLNAFNKWAKRCVTAHIVPKSLFPEVATHPSNRAFMGVALFSDCSCHNTFDHLDADTRKQMPIYPKIVERVKLFIHLIPENKLNRLKKYLGLND